MDSLPKRDEFSNLSSEDDFETSNFHNMEISHPTPLPKHYCHNFNFSGNFIMESNCLDHCFDSNQDDGAVSTSTNIKHDNSSNQESILQMLQLISTQMVTKTNELNNRLASVEWKFTQELQRIAQENDTFRRNMRAELQTNLSSVTIPVSSSTPSHPSSGQPSAPPAHSMGNPLSISSCTMSSSSSLDFQCQMLSLLTDTFSKLTTGVSDSKLERPKFNGDSKTFQAWYLAIMAQLSLSPWLDL